MGSLDALLEVQEHDNAVDRLRARREKLPERPQLEERRAEEADLDTQLAALREHHDEVARDEKRLDDTVTAIRERMGEVERTMYGGGLSNPRELQALQAEVEQFKRQLHTLEDQELDVMEQREGLERELAVLEERMTATRQAIQELQVSIETQESAIDADLEAEREARTAVTAGVAPDVLDLYEEIRLKNRGVGAARLVGGTCQACHLALPAVEVDRIKREPPDALVRCDQCGAILVRA
jgi:predicted  nucleic acid-binding Zn-ribbon protein